MNARIVELVDAACAYGWDREHALDVERVRALLADDPALARAEVAAACVAGDADALAALLEEDPTRATRSCGPREWEPLLYLAFSHVASERAECARLLLKYGADPNARYEASGCPFPVLYAAIAVTRDLALARVVLEAGAKPSDTQTLYHACEQFSLEPLRLLGEFALEPDEVSYCLKHVLDFNYADGVRWFLEAGADPNAVHPSAGETALHWAVKRASPLATIELLCEHGADPNRRTKRGRTAFLKIRGWTPYDLAVQLGRTDVAELLLARGAVPSPMDDEDRFLAACARGDADEARALLARRPALLDELPQEDQRLIAHVAQTGNTAAVALMLELGFDPGARGWMDATPMHWAACLGNVEILDALLARGAPLVDVGGYFGTPLHTARHNRWREDGDYEGVLERLERASPKENRL